MTPISLCKETEVLRLIESGKTIKEIALMAGVSPRTVNRIKSAGCVRAPSRPGRKSTTVLDSTAIDPTLLPTIRQFDVVPGKINMERAVGVLRDVCSLYDLHLIANPLFNNLARVSAEVLGDAK